MSVKETTQITSKLNAIYMAAEFLQTNFVDKKVAYVGEETTLAIIFIASNFMHFFGIDYRRSAHLFFQDALEKKLTCKT